MLFDSSKVSLFLISSAAIAVNAQELNLRGTPFETTSVKDAFTCTIEGAAGQDACDAAKADDGSACVWCPMQGFGVCLDAEEAEALEKIVPGLQCDGDSGADDDAVANDDDDSVPDDDYWKCLQEYHDSGECSDAGCTWCDTKQGYGICVESSAAERISGYDWFTCDTGLSTEDVAPKKDLKDISDPSCLIATLQGGDKTSCEATSDQSGQACEWCSLPAGAADLCVTDDQAEVVEQLGGSCGESNVEVEKAISNKENAQDPYDPSCLIATLQGGDESACEAAVDQSGAPCEWCSLPVGAGNVCLNDEQAAMAEQLGGSCSNGSTAAKEEVKAEDPYDTSCLMASLQGDETACEATLDQTGQACEWCTLPSANLCLTEDQAEIAEQLGADCGGGDQEDAVGVATE